MRQNHRRLLLSSAMVLTLALFGCGVSSGANSTNTASTDTTDAPTEDTKESKLRTEEFKDVVLVDNDTVTILLEKFYQEEAYEHQSSGEWELTTNNYIAVKMQDKTAYGSSVDTDAYLDNEELFLPRTGANFSGILDAGKTIHGGYVVEKNTQPDPTPLDSFDDLYRISLKFEIMEKNEKGYFNADEKTIVEVNLGDAIDGKVNPASEDGDKTEKQDSGSDDSKKQEDVTYKELSVGDTITNDDWELTLTKAGLTKEILPSDTSDYYYYSYTANEGVLYFDLEFDVKCLAEKESRLSDVMGASLVKYANKYEFNTCYFFFSKNDTRITDASNLVFDPLQKIIIHNTVCNIPEEATTNDESIIVYVKINGEIYQLNYR